MRAQSPAAMLAPGVPQTLARSAPPGGLEPPLSTAVPHSGRSQPTLSPGRATIHVHARRRSRAAGARLRAGGRPASAAVAVNGQPQPVATSATDTSCCRPAALRAGAEPVSTSTSTPATRRSIATTTSSTRSSCRRGRTRRSPLRSAGPEGALDAGARRARRLGRRSATAPRRRAARRPTAAPASASPRPQPISIVPVRVRRRQVFDRAGERNGRTVPHLAPRNRRRRRSRATATRSSICTPARSTGWSATPASRIRSASSICCWCRRFSSAAWSTPARCSTTRRRCCSTSRRRRTSCSSAPARSRTKPRTCGSATW